MVVNYQRTIYRITWDWRLDMAFSLPSGAHTTRGTLDLDKDVQSPQVNAHYIFGAAAEESVVNAVDVDASLELLKRHSSSQVIS